MKYRNLWRWTIISVKVEHNTEAKKEYFPENLIAKNVKMEAKRTYEPSNSSKKNNSTSPIINENNCRFNGFLIAMKILPET